MEYNRRNFHLGTVFGSFVLFTDFIFTFDELLRIFILITHIDAVSESKVKSEKAVMI